MRLVKFQMLNGQPVFLNPDHVVKVLAIESGRTRISHEAGINDVSHGLNEVVRLLTLRSMPDDD